MLDILILACGIGVGTPVPILGAVAAVLMMPTWFVAILLGGCVAVAIRRRRTAEGDSEAAFLRSVATELQAGATLRMALVAASDWTPDLELGEWARRARAGRPMGELARELQSRLPISGTATSAAVQFATDSGAASNDLFAGLAQQAGDAVSLRHERTTATAQVRLSVAVVAGAPLPVLLWLIARGSLGALTATNAGRLVLLLGIGLQAVGGLVTVVMLRKHRS